MTALPKFDEMSSKQVQEWGKEVASRAAQFGELQATLIVNCRPGRALHGLGIEYDESKPTLTNMVFILEQLVAKAKQATEVTPKPEGFKP